jgi:GNAT superfamily N-acetyltransferase
MTIRACGASDFHAIAAVCNDGAAAYHGVIAADRWRTPYMPDEELRREIAAGVRFFGAFDEGQTLVGVMGLQQVADVALIRHAYTRTDRQRNGIGSALLAHVRSVAERPLLVGTWQAAAWAIRFYERHGFRLVDQIQRERLLRRYWTIPERQIEDSVVLACERWFAREAGTDRP